MPDPIQSICILRLSALGDVTHVVPLIRAIQKASPKTQITWVIGKTEARFLSALEGVEFIVFDKAGGLKSILQLRKQLAGRSFDVLLHMQLALRANIFSSLSSAKRKIGYDTQRSKEGHGLFVSERISAGGFHVQDAFLQFLAPCGIEPGKLEWCLPTSESDRAWAQQHIPDQQATLLISPCSSHRLRNWHASGYAALADHAHSKSWRVILCGGRSAIERAAGDEILSRTQAPVIDLIGKDTFGQFLALCARAKLFAGPDSGPVHMANAMGLKVLGLYACTNAKRSGPYSDLRYTINQYELAAQRFERKPADQLPWGKRIERPGVMDLISINDVLDTFDRFCADQF